MSANLSPFDVLWPTLFIPGEFDSMDACDQARWRGVIGAAFDAGLSAQASEVEALRAKVAEWEKLRDPVTLHVSLLRGFPARLSRAVFLHLAGDEEPKF